jgi:hypothetical protein
MVKKWWQSKTVWFNLISLVIGVLVAVLGIVREQTWAVILTVFIAVGNGVLRIWFTDSSIAAPPKTP